MVYILVRPSFLNASPFIARRGSRALRAWRPFFSGLGRVRGRLTALVAASSTRPFMLFATTSMLPRALRATPMLARAAPVMRVPLARMPVAMPVMTRGFASAGGPSLEEIKARINEVLKSFEKVDAAKLTPTASFMNDLGLDSLDAVEVVMAIEEEFNIVCAPP